MLQSMLISTRRYRYTFAEIFANSHALRLTARALLLKEPANQEWEFLDRIARFSLGGAADDLLLVLKQAAALV